MVTSTPSASSPIPALLRLSQPLCFSRTPLYSNSIRSSPCAPQAPLRRTHSMMRGAYYAYSSRQARRDMYTVPGAQFTRQSDRSVCAAGLQPEQVVHARRHHGGGHLSWFQLGGAPNRWARRPVLGWFRATGEDIWLEPRKARSIEWRGGWIMVYRRMVTEVECASLWSLLQPPFTTTYTQVTKFSVWTLITCTDRSISHPYGRDKKIT